MPGGVVNGGTERGAKVGGLRCPEGRRGGFARRSGAGGAARRCVALPGWVGVRPAPSYPTTSARAAAPLRAGRGALWRRSGARGRSRSRIPEPERSGVEPGRSGPSGPSQQPSWGRGRAACTGPGRRGRGRSPAARGALGSSVPGSSGTCFRTSPSWTGSCGSAGR